MTKKQTETMQAVEQAWPQMTDFHKGFILGIAEASMRETEKEEKSHAAAVPVA